MGWFKKPLLFGVDPAPETSSSNCAHDPGPFINSAAVLLSRPSRQKKEISVCSGIDYKPSKDHFNSSITHRSAISTKSNAACCSENRQIYFLCPIHTHNLGEELQGNGAFHQSRQPDHQVGEVEVGFYTRWRWALLLYQSLVTAHGVDHPRLVMDALNFARFSASAMNRFRTECTAINSIRFGKTTYTAHPQSPQNPILPEPANQDNPCLF